VPNGADDCFSGEQPGFISAAFQADGTYANKWLIQAGGTVEPTTTNLPSGCTTTALA